MFDISGSLSPSLGLQGPLCPQQTTWYKKHILIEQLGTGRKLLFFLNHC